MPPVPTYLRVAKKPGIAARKTALASNDKCPEIEIVFL
jgi:hypothetical protein